MSSTDLRIEVTEQPEGKTPLPDSPVKPQQPGSKPSKLPSWLQSKRNKVLAGLGLLTLIAVPCIVGPSVAAAQAKQRQRNATIDNVKRDPTAGELRFTDDRSGRTTSFDASRFAGNDTLGNSTLKVPRRTRQASTKPERWSPFIKIKDGQFDQHCRPFYPVGFNAFELTTLAATNRKEQVDAVYSQAASMGMTAARTWAHSISQKWPFQVAPGSYDEQGLQALDYVIHSAAKHGIKLILSFIDNWKYYNGVDQYVDWCMPGREMPRPPEGAEEDLKMSDGQKRYETKRHAEFFRAEACKKLYKDHVAFLTNRTNAYNGIQYKNDPTILAWNLINEPRCETWMPENSWCHQGVADWFKEMADYVRTVDPNHLVTSGSEGFFGQGDANVGRNPQPWAQQTGQNFLTDNQHMDFAVLHAWPDNWQIPNERQAEFLRSWLDSHLSVAESMGKPLLFEEFGKKLDSNNAADIAQLRDPVYEASYNAVEQAIENNRPLLGSLYWKWSVPSVQSGPYDVDLEDSTMGVIRRHANLMHRLVNSVPPRPGCVFPLSERRRTGAWFADTPNGRTGDCINAPDVSLAFYSLYGQGGRSNTTHDQLGLSKAAVTYARALRRGRVSVYPTRRDCCMPKLGAYPRGCTGAE